MKPDATPSCSSCPDAPKTSSTTSVAAPGVGAVDFGDLRRLQPISRVFGFDRGLCVDRYFIERFLSCHSDDIHGRVLEVADNEYTRRFGGIRVTHSEVLHATAGNRKATMVADLTRADSLPANAFDCVILTQTLQHIYDTRAALASVSRALGPGGVVLITVPGISQISRYDMERWGDFWRFTTPAVRRLLEDVFHPGDIKVESRGNVLAATAFLQGLSAGELAQAELDFIDPDYELLITARAVKAGEEDR